MSVRTMTTEQLRADLDAVARMFKDGIPAEQNDRVNALKSELKRRGASAPTGDAEPAAALGLEDMNDARLEKELRRLSERINKSPDDEALQSQFADVRFEMRKRAKMVAPVPQIDLSEASEPEVKRLVQRQTNGNGQVAAEQGDLVARAAKNAETMKHIEETHLKMQRVQVAAMVAAKLLSEMTTSVAEIDGDGIESAGDVALRLVDSLFTKVGL
jgi:ribosomal protein L18